MNAPITQEPNPVIDQIQDEFAAKIRNAFDETLRENRHLSPVQLGMAVGVMGAAMMQFAAVRYINDEDSEGVSNDALRAEFIALASTHFDIVSKILNEKKGTMQ